MNKKLIAITAVMMLLAGSMAFAANDNSNNQMRMNQNSGYAQHNSDYVQMPMNQNGGYTQHNGDYVQMPMNQNGHQNGQHMYRLSDKAKRPSTSTWNSVCKFFGMNGGHGGRNGGNMGRGM